MVLIALRVAPIAVCSPLSCGRPGTRWTFCATACARPSIDRWDEEKFGFEYDLDLFNIVAVDDFNMGANVLSTSLHTLSQAKRCRRLRPGDVLH